MHYFSVCTVIVPARPSLLKFTQSNSVKVASEHLKNWTTIHVWQLLLPVLCTELLSNRRKWNSLTRYFLDESILLCVIYLLVTAHVLTKSSCIFSDFLGTEGKLKFVIPPILISLKPGIILFFFTHAPPAFQKFCANCSRIASTACTNALG